MFSRNESDPAMKADLELVLRKAARLVTPTEFEAKKLEKVVARVRLLLAEEFHGQADVPEISLGGSYAKGTWLKGGHDIDFFLQYPKEYSREKLETVALDSAKSAIEGYEINIRFAEHPYVETFIDGVRVNLVPCYNVVQGEWQSAADRSPYHANYVKSKFDEKLKLEARLLKRFTKSIGVYGAEVKTQGFSGYVCEVLVLKNGSFQKTLESLAAIKGGDVISIEPFDKTLTSLFKSPLVILDPVDTTRNLGTAISERNIAKLSLYSRRFLARPALSFFSTEKKRSKITPAAEALLENTIVVEFANKKRSPDILWGQLRKSANSLSDKIEMLGFEVLRCAAASDEKTRSALLFLLVGNRISALHVRQGPEYFRSEEVERYFSKNEKKSLLTFIGEDGRLRSIRQRDKGSVEIRGALESLLTKKLDSLGISKEIRSEIKHGAKIKNGLACLNRYRNPNHWLVSELLSIVSDE